MKSMNLDNNKNVYGKFLKALRVDKFSYNLLMKD